MLISDVVVYSVLKDKVLVTFYTSEDIKMLSTF